jgi:hypothetical protein
MNSIQIAWKHDSYGSDYLGISVNSREEAESVVNQLKNDPTKLGFSEWIKDAQLWIEENDAD